MGPVDSGDSPPGLVVAIFGREPDPLHAMALALLEHGATVVLCPDWSPFSDPPDEQSALASLCFQHPGQAFLLTGLDGHQFMYVFEESRGPGRFVAWARRSFGRLDAVVLGFHTGYGKRDPAIAFARALGRTGGEVLAVEGDASSCDDVVRWVARDPRITVVRAAAGPRRRRKPAGLGPVARLLNDVCGLVPTTLADADRHAARRRTSGTDPIAGLLWHPIGFDDFDSAGCAVVTSRSLATARRPIYENVEWSRSSVTRLDAYGVDGVVVRLDNGLGNVEVAPSWSAAFALRAGCVADAFATDDPYVAAADWQPHSTELLIGDAYRVLDHGEGFRVRIRRQPRWQIDLASLDGEQTGFRMWSGAARRHLESR